MKRSNLNRKQQEDGVTTEVEVGAEQTKAANGGGSKQPQIPSAEPSDESASATNQTSSNTTAETTQTNQRNQPQILVNSRLNLNKRARLMSESSTNNTISGNGFNSASTRRIHQFMGGSNHEFLTEQAFFLHPFRSAGGRVRAHSSNSVQWQSDSNAEPQPQAPAFVSPLASSRDYRMAHTRRAFPFIGDEEDDYEGESISFTYSGERRPFSPTSSSLDEQTTSNSSAEDLHNLHYQREQEPSPIDGVIPKSVAAKRLTTELEELEQAPVPHCHIGVCEDRLNSPIFHWAGVVDGPPKTPYEGGTFFFEIVFDEKYPFEAPNVSFLTRIYHCNINSQGQIQVEPIYSGWDPSKRVSDILAAIVSILRKPKPSPVSHALVPKLAEHILNDPEDFFETARIWTQRYAS